MAGPAREPLLLIGESFSPWTQKARWALEHCGVAHRYEEYVPTLSEPWLRWRMRCWTEPVSVPVMRTPDGWLRGSWDIARYAAAAAGDSRLGDMAAIVAWNALGDAALAEGRTRVVRGIAVDPQAQAESLPRFLPAPLHGSLRWLARDAVRRLDRKYAALLVEGSLRRALLETRRALAASGGDFLLGRFSYADIAMIVVLECVAPVARTVPPLGPATRRLWRDPVLAEEFADMIDWRSRLLAMPGVAGHQFRPTTADATAPGRGLRTPSGPRTP
ncbi:MAG TPA: glutathione S-transferase family protein [Luteimonas sp.]|nr:glutathione S-transferase family protein [Luteimonas sp.]HRP73835.1 glutathione S-transferase family protein [Luteimonas sp.]